MRYILLVLLLPLALTCKERVSQQDSLGLVDTLFEITEDSRVCLGECSIQSGIRVCRKAHKELLKGGIEAQVTIDRNKKATVTDCKNLLASWSTTAHRAADAHNNNKSLKLHSNVTICLPCRMASIVIEQEGLLHRGDREDQLLK